MKKTMGMLAFFVVAGFLPAEDMKPAGLGATISGDFAFDYDVNQDVISGNDTTLDRVSFEKATVSWAQKTNDFMKSYVELNLLAAVNAESTTTNETETETVKATDGTDHEVVTSVNSTTTTTASSALINQAWFEWNLFQIIRLQGGLAPEAYGLTKYAKNSYLLGASLDLFLVEATLQVGNDDLIVGNNDTFVIPQVKAKLGDFIQAGLSTKIDLETAVAAAKTKGASALTKADDRHQEFDINAFGTFNLLNFITAKADVYALDALNDTMEVVGYAEASVDLIALIPGANVVVYNILDNEKAFYSGNASTDADVEASLGVRLAPGMVFTGSLGLQNVLHSNVGERTDWYGFIRMNWTPSVSF